MAMKLEQKQTITEELRGHLTSAEVVYLTDFTGLTVEEQQPNVMVLASQTLDSDASVTLKLMYLDPSQFLEQAT